MVMLPPRTFAYQQEMRFRRWKTSADLRRRSSETRLRRPVVWKVPATTDQPVSSCASGSTLFSSSPCTLNSVVVLVPWSWSRGASRPALPGLCHGLGLGLAIFKSWSWS